jgi:hypothetical protein
VLGELDRETRHAALDQDFLATLELQRVFD